MIASVTVHNSCGGKMFISVLNRISSGSLLVVIIVGLQLWPGRVRAQTASMEQIEGYWTGAFNIGKRLP